MSYNKIILVGNLVRDIELKYTQSGTGIANTAIATSHKYTSNGEKKEEVCFTDITFMGRSSEIATQYLRKGSKILVEGRLKLDQWVDANGQKRSKHSVMVESMQMLDSKDSSQQSHPQQSYQSTPQGQPQQREPHHTDYREQPQQRQMPDKNALPIIDVEDSEIPF